jgi:hypothetical protein
MRGECEEKGRADDGVEECYDKYDQDNVPYTRKET